MTPMRGKALPLGDGLGRTAHTDPHVTAATKRAQPEAMKIWKAEAFAPLLGRGKESRPAAGGGTAEPLSLPRRAAIRPHAACLPSAALLISAS